MAVRVERFQTVGVRYCVQHHGTANEDNGDECDFRRDEPFPCNFRQLGYLKATR